MKPKIVVVEDEHPIAEAERMILEDQYEVHVVDNAEEGYKLIEEHNPEIALLDVMLPGMSGFDLAKKIRSNSNLNATKIVMVTAKNQQKDEIHGMNLGADDYIMKPFEPDELLHVVAQVMKPNSDD